MVDVANGIPFTQYLRPDGRRIKIMIACPKNIYDKAMDIIEKGYCFEAEVLTTGHVSLTIADENGDLAVELAANGPKVLDAVDRLVTKFHDGFVNTSKKD